MVIDHRSALGDGDSDLSGEPPVHPVPQLQGPFEESMMEALTDEKEADFTLDAVERRAKLLDNHKYERVCAGRWKQKPGEKFHPLWKLSAQLSFGVHLLAQELAKSEEDVMTILQNHVDDIDGFLERTSEDLTLAQEDINERLHYLQVPFEHVEVFDRMLEDKKFRNTIVTGNEKIEHILERTSVALTDTLKDCQKGLDATKSLGSYLDSLRGQWKTQSPDFEAVYVAMVGNCEGWNIAFRNSLRKGEHLSRSLSKLARLVDEMQRRCGLASRKGLFTTEEPPKGIKKMKSFRLSRSKSVMHDLALSEAEKALPSAPVPYNASSKTPSASRSRHVSGSRQASEASSEKDAGKKVARERLSHPPHAKPYSERGRLVKKRLSAPEMKGREQSTDVPPLPEQRPSELLLKVPNAPPSSKTASSGQSSRRSSAMKLMGRPKTAIAEDRTPNTDGPQSHETRPTTSGGLKRSASFSMKLFGRKPSFSRSHSDQGSLTSKSSARPTDAKTDDESSRSAVTPEPSFPTPPSLTGGPRPAPSFAEQVTALPETTEDSDVGKSFKFRALSSHPPAEMPTIQLLSPPNGRAVRAPPALNIQEKVTSPVFKVSKSKSRESMISPKGTALLTSPKPDLPLRSPRRGKDRTQTVLETIIASATPPDSPVETRPEKSINSSTSTTSNNTDLTIAINPPQANIPLHSSQFSPSTEAPPPPPPGGRKMVEPDFASAGAFEGERPIRTAMSGASMNTNAWKKMFASGASAAASRGTSRATSRGTSHVTSPSRSEFSSNKSVSATGLTTTAAAAEDPNWFKGMGKDGVWVAGETVQ